MNRVITVNETIKLRRIREQRASLMFLLSGAYETIFEGSLLTIEHSFENGYFCHDAEEYSIDEKSIGKLESTIRSWLENNEKIILSHLPKDEALKLALNKNFHGRQEVIEKWPSNSIPIIQFNHHWDLRYGPMTTDKSLLKNFEIVKYMDGILARFPPFHDPAKLVPFQDHPKLFSVIKESEEKGGLLGVSIVNDLNELIRNGGIKELIWTTESIQERKIVQIADQLTSEFPWKRVITVAGPSSSGKTTFSKRLKIQLKVNGFRTLTLSMDDYFLDRDKIPFDNNGNQNFEKIDALDKELIAQQVDQLISGNRIKIRKFDFETGKGVFINDTLELGDWDFILLEGIHGLNPDLTGLLAEENIQKIYVSAMTPLNIDRHHRVSTSDNRLIRRIIRDMKFRGYSISETLERWPSVREGEEKYIFPYQERADHIFNSALIYEPAILAQQILKDLDVSGNDSEFIKEEKHRLQLFLSFFEPVKEDLVPGISILREFIGGSDFDY